MKVKLLLASVAISFSLVEGVHAQDHGLCKPGLMLSLTPALARPGEVVPIWVNFISAPDTFFAINARVSYPQGIEPVISDIGVVPPPSGIFQLTHNEKIILSDLDQRWVAETFDLASNATMTAGAGPSFLFPFLISSTLSPGDLTLTIIDGETLNTNMYCYYPEPTPGLLRVTGPGGRGDVDGNGRVTIPDALWAIKLWIGTATGSPGVVQSAKVTSPGSEPGVTLGDVRTILRAAIGLETL